MNSQNTTGFEQLAPGRTRQLGRLGGELTVLSGSIWLTREGMLADHFLDAGTTVRIAVGAHAVIESGARDTTATLRWTARRQTLAGRIFAEPLLVLAFLTRIAARSVTLLARSAAAAARRAQGCIDAQAELANGQRS